MSQNFRTAEQPAESRHDRTPALPQWRASSGAHPDLMDDATGYRRADPDQLLDHVTPAPRVPTAVFSFIDLFAGIGGLRLAFEEQGGHCIFSSEIDRFACRTYEANFGDRPHGDITRTEAGDIPPHDLLLAGFPCQPFSISGVSKYQSLGREHGFLDQTKGTLFFDIVRVLRHHQPKAFLLENVKNLRSHDGGKTYRVIRAALDELGYTVYAQVIDAKLLVPQHRKRIFIVGFRDPVPFAFPAIADRQPRISDILEADPASKYTLSDHLWEYLQAYAEKHRAKGNGFGFGLVPPHGITRTLSARYYKDGSEILIPQPERPPRRLTPRTSASDKLGDVKHIHSMISAMLSDIDRKI